MVNQNLMGIYIHIPFCVKKCNYCDFLSFPIKKETVKPYIEALLSEIKAYGRMYGKYGSKGSFSVPTVFFGGGTPSILEAKYISQIMTALRENFYLSDNAEITIECNPGTLNFSKLSDYKSIGINRLSIGLQSSCDAELALLGRVHTYRDFEENYKNALKAGFNNINIDIMSALPGQTISSYRDTLNRVLQLKPRHISAYSLIIEENTPFYNIYGNSSPHGDSFFPPLPDEDTEREMYYMTDEMLKENGYCRYEISNYALDGFCCRHNEMYWKRGHYLGFGPGASSFMGNCRFKNISDMEQYIKKCRLLDSGETEDFSFSSYYISSIAEPSEIYYLNDSDAMAEYMYLGLRMTKGISVSRFKTLFGVDLYDIYGNIIKKHIEEKLLIREDDFLRLTAKGTDISNYILSDFII